MSERRLAVVLTRRFTRVAWTGLAGYALLVVALFAAAAEMALRRSLEHSADLTQSLLGAYRDSTSEPGGVMPSALADQLVAMGGQVVITRTTTAAGGQQQVYFVSPDMPAKRLEGLPANASPDDVRRALLAAIAQRSRWRYRVLHRSAGAFDIYVVASRESYVVALGALAAAATGVQVGAAIVATRYVAADSSPASLAFLRYAIGVACLIPAVAMAGRMRFARADILPIAALGIGQFGILIALLNYGLRSVPAGRGALIFASFPLITLIVAALLGHEHATVRKIGGILATMAGIALALGDKILGAGSILGELTILASAAVGAVCSVLYRPYLRRYPTLPVSAFAMAAA
ncbi:MAG TPA: DMT family transporter, partial [Gemmatimonadales bacterium]